MFNKTPSLILFKRATRSITVNTPALPINAILTFFSAKTKENNFHVTSEGYVSYISNL